MLLEDYLKDLIVRFRGISDSQEQRLRCFHRYEVQVEGWLKGELLYFLHEEKGAGRIMHFDREVSVGPTRKKVDLKIEIPTDSGTLEAWIELKHWLIGPQKGTHYNAQFYFRESGSVGIKPDAEKLSRITNGSKLLLILATKNPGVDDWSAGVSEFNSKFSPLHLKSLTSPSDYPDYYYLGFLEVTRPQA